MDIIDSFNKLTLGKYDEIKTISQDETLEEVDRVVGIISVLTDVSEEEFLSAEAFNPGRMAKKYVIGGMELIPVTDFRKLETCQYLDFQTYAGDLDNHMVELISVLLVPKGHRYNEGYDILEVQQAIRDGMTVTEGVSVVTFFLTLFKGLIKDSLDYSKEMAKGIKDKTKREEILEKIQEQETLLERNGVGSDV